ncbi:MAG: methionine--tRNA ligase [Bdellovibrionaceae bacterium]|nr:methionine--tRNA ligase [Pseudobdellovibrionaceae bacterium]
MKRKHLVTSALPYANDPLHFGHLAGVYLPADVYVRHLKKQGHDVLHICGSDEHGVAIMLGAEKEGKDYQTYVNEWHEDHRSLFEGYGIEFEVFGQTSSKNHEEEVLKWFHALYEGGYIEKKSEPQLYCISDQMFLPDRYVEGTCYECGYEKARGDECPECGTWIEATRLIRPRSTVSGSSDIEIREASHYYLMLSKFESEYRSWYAEKKGQWRKLVSGFVGGLLENGMVDRAISRDLKWGIPVPLPEAEGKRLYVWFDAPIGYVSNTKEYLEKNRPQEDYLKDWWLNPEVEISHFLGKDNIIFHALIWPCMCMGSRRALHAKQVYAQEFLNLEGRQFSKSAGWTIDAKKALEDFGEDNLRFALLQMIPETGDTNFTFDGLAQSNAEFGNKVGNFVHRVLSFMNKKWPDGLSSQAFASIGNDPHLQVIEDGIKKIQTELNQSQLSKAIVELMNFGQTANEFFHAAEPWKVIKEDEAQAERLIALSVIHIAAIGIVLEPFVPHLSNRLMQSFEHYFSKTTEAEVYQGNFESLMKAFEKGFKLSAPPEVLMPRIDSDLIEQWKNSLFSNAKD